MKDTKNILILVLLAGCLVFGYTWFFRGNSAYKQKIKELEKEKAELVKERLVLDLQVDSLNKDYQKLLKKEAELSADIASRDKEILRRKKEAERTQAELSNLKNGLKETQEKIAEHKKNPPNRSGDDLLNSLKIKTQQ